MATVTGLTKERMEEIEAASVVSGLVNGSGHLILTRHDASTIDAGNVIGPTGPTGNVIVCTSGTRPGSPTNGTAIYETDTKLFLIWNGSAWIYHSGLLPAGYRTSGTAQSMASGSDTLVNWTTSVLQGGVAAPNAQTLSVPVKGIYQVSGSMRIAGNGTAGFDEASIYVYNSSGVFQSSWFTDGGPFLNVGGVDETFNPGGPIFLNAGDRVALRFWGNKGTRNNTVGGVGGTILSVALLTPWA